MSLFLMLYCFISNAQHDILAKSAKTGAKSAKNDKR